MFYFLFIFASFFIILLFFYFFQDQDPLDNSIYGPQAVNGSQLAGPEQVLNNHEKDSTLHRQLSEMSQYEGATLGQPSKSIVYINFTKKKSRKKIGRVFF